jgi:carboxyvinyl-carboxyphosphonate phosphorylmutase
MDLVIAGRTSAAGVTNIDDAIERAVAYEQVGVDAIFLVGVKTRADLDKVFSVIKTPIILGGGGEADMLDLDYLSSRNVRICLQGHQPFSAAVQAIYDTLKALRDGVPAKDLKGIASADLLKKVTRHTHYNNMTMKYLGNKR